METVVVAIVAPVILALILGWQQRRAKREDWAREDAVAAKAAEAARLLLAANERVAETTQVTNDKLDVIHTLVNSNVTKEMEARLEGSRREVAALREIVELRKQSGQDPTEEALAAILSTEEGVHELENDLADRRRQQRVVEQQQQQQQQP
jgi:hypothetical protein